MDSKIKNILKIVKDKLNEDPASITYGELNERNSNIKNENEKLKQYFDFLEYCDGARFGGIDLWSFEELLLNQYRITELPEKGQKWLEIGQILYEPLVINRENGEVSYFLQEQPNDFKYNFGSFDDFLINYVFGKKYSEIIPESIEDDWYQFIQALNRR